MATPHWDMRADPGDHPGTGKARNGVAKKRTVHWLVHFGVLLTLFLAVGAGILWYMADGQLTVEGSGNVPLILADKDPFKVRPENPGGMNVPGQGRLIYDRMEEEGASPLTETLLPPPEDPLPPPEPEAKVIAEFKDGIAVNPVAPAPTPPAPVVAPEPAPAPVVSAAPLPSPPAVEPQPEPALPSQPVPSSQRLGAGGYLVQLASVRTPEAVDREWVRLKSKHLDLLGGLDLFMQRADLGLDKGVFYRLRVGPLDEAGARAVCADLKTRNVPCLPVSGDN